jgi:acetolactate synthase regulatory subunit
MLLLPSGVAPSTVARLDLHLTDAPGALLRVLGLCQRRGAQVVALTYHGDRLELALQADARRVALIRAKLESAIYVLSVSGAGEAGDQRPLVRPEPGRRAGGGVLADALGT